MLVFCKEALFGVLSPISFLTEANLQKAIDALENRVCDFVYVALDHFDEREKQLSERYLKRYVENLEPGIQSKIFVSASSKPYVEMFAEYVSQIPGEVCVDIFARVDEKNYIENALNAILDTQCAVSKGNMPLVFVGAGRVPC